MASSPYQPPRVSHSAREAAGKAERRSRRRKTGWPTFMAEGTLFLWMASIALAEPLVLVAQGALGFSPCELNNCMSLYILLRIPKEVYKFAFISLLLQTWLDLAIRDRSCKPRRKHLALTGDTALLVCVTCQARCFLLGLHERSVLATTLVHNCDTTIILSNEIDTADLPKCNSRALKPSKYPSFVNSHGVSMITCAGSHIFLTDVQFVHLPIYCAALLCATWFFSCL